MACGNYGARQFVCPRPDAGRADEDVLKQLAVSACYLAISGAGRLVRERSLLDPTYHGG